ncbi:hypothetical protein JOD64_002303 [Micromonospora luteifusca]|uniref:Uncharacterized protein n=1 Tax=Micromonospora luteifusca TaxID=709860 RepID=A0ABS2LSD0_9ACTN|nr:hypothetical protein [Micromonospora luteifusca]MBM7491081.1 hypothetical protein [Micromonospora luteifusca]
MTALPGSTFVGAYQGMSLLANALRDPEIMTREGARLTHWLDTLPGDVNNAQKLVNPVSERDAVSQG